jgi:hypothetical protein
LFEPILISRPWRFAPESVDVRGSSRGADVASQIIVDIGAEGGSLTVFGQKNAAGEWKFGEKRDETTLYDSEEDPDGTDFKHFYETTGCILTFGEAIARLDRYRWFRLYPLEVHPEFLDAVLLEVRMRGGEVEEARWRETLAEKTPWCRAAVQTQKFGGLFSAIYRLLIHR